MEQPQSPPRLGLPDDLVAFLAAGKRLEYDPSRCEMGELELAPLAELQRREFPSRPNEQDEEFHFIHDDDPNHDDGVYLVPAVSLVAFSSLWEPNGLLLWLPNEQHFGGWSDVLLRVHVLRQVSWTELAEDPLRFLNALFNRDEALVDELTPWPKYPFRKSPSGLNLVRRCT
jgi:hypothetical protein